MQLWHYYGDIVRRLFLVVGIIMIITLPFFTHLIPVKSAVSIMMIVGIGFVAGLISPFQPAVVGLKALIAAGALFFFEYYAVIGYHLSPETDKATLFLLTNQILAIIFFFALYYSAKTLRGLKGR